jgi:hypothetical protein
MPDKPSKFEDVYAWWAFIIERWKQADKIPGFDDDFKRALIDLVRSETPLDPNKIRQWLADELENRYFPLPPGKERKRGRQFKDAAYRFAIERYAKAKGVSKTQAKADLFAIMGLDSVEALEKRLTRAKQERKEVPHASKAKARPGQKL